LPDARKQELIDTIVQVESLPDVSVLLDLLTWRDAD
jgi:hypothetical protein